MYNKKVSYKDDYSEMIPDLKEKILTLRKEIDTLIREKNEVSKEIDKKKDRLRTLEKLTVNQMDLFDET